METLTINGKANRHVGLPLAAYTQDGESWSGNSNILTDHESTRTNIHLNGLTDCFWWMKEWNKEEDVKAGFVLDFTTKTAYYDNNTSLAYIKEKFIPAQKWENYFEHFIQKDFTK